MANLAPPKSCAISYHLSEIFRVGLIFAEFATSLKLSKVDTAKK